MSHTRYPPPRQRVQRSELAVPGSNPQMFDKAAASEADFVFLDLEDAVEELTFKQLVLADIARDHFCDLTSLK